MAVWKPLVIEFFARNDEGNSQEIKTWAYNTHYDDLLKHYQREVDARKRMYPRYAHMVPEAKELLERDMRGETVRAGITSALHSLWKQGKLDRKPCIGICQWTYLNKL